MDGILCYDEPVVGISYEKRIVIFEMESLKTRYPDWDEPSEENEALCKKFSMERWRGQAVSLPYRMFVPERLKTETKNAPYGALKYPLVVFLHGADVVGNDNKRHLLLHDIGTIFARDDWQKRHPCYILAPQYGREMHWSQEEMQETMLLLISHLLKRYDRIDEKRVYIYGYSAGGVGTLELLKRTDLFAAAMVICGTTYHVQLDQLIRTPIWLLHAADDRIVSPNRKAGFGVEYMGSKALYDLLKGQEGAQLFYTEYPKGELKEKYGLNPHCAWVPAGQDEEVKEWLFLQKR
ncbi:MAG: prolyl oligopeptidase family serine peptidase [Lachnospiraceae bacterium]|nr:prolyl oligopeptidase family serine peptidase [Lachnospiraceae bacterium]